MTKELRIAKLKMLIGNTDYVDRHRDRDGVPTHYTVRWVAPRDRQTATIDAKTGNITSWRSLDGDVINEVASSDGSCLNVAKVDRRINWLMVSNNLKVAS